MSTRAVVIGVGVAAAQQAFHAATAGARLTALHALGEMLLAIPLAAAALWIGERIARTSRAASLGGAIVFCALLVPAGVIHSSWHATATHAHAHGSVRADAFGAVVAHAGRDAFLSLGVAYLLFAATAVARRRPASRGGRARPRLVLVMLASVLAFAGLPGTAPVAAATVTPFTKPLRIPTVLTDPEITLNAQASAVPILDGAPTDMWTFNGEFPGPTIRRPSGVPTKLTVVNQLPGDVGEITVHHHGAHAAPEHDGQPHEFLIPPGGNRTYTYEMMEDGAPERAAMQWYHDHRMDVTGRNVWMGLAGMFIVDDPVDSALPLPKGEYDVPLMVVDRSFDAGNQLEYEFDALGARGDTTLVNGVPWPYFEVADRKYRLRILNASNERAYDFALPAGMTMTQIGTESGLLPVPVERTHIRLGPAERAEVVVDFAGRLGQDIVLRNALSVGAMSNVMEFRVRRDEVDDSSIPATLRPAPVFTDDEPVSMTRTWMLGQILDPDPFWTINGRGFDAHRIDTAPLNPRLGSTERWIFVNATTVDHIVHIHDVDWRIVTRIGGEEPQDPADIVAEQGLKESFRVQPGEIVEVMSRFTDHVGKYVLHCHVLEHEDRAMMANFEVVA